MNYFSTFAGSKVFFVKALKATLMALILSTVLAGCRSGGSKGEATLPANLVNNPNSASGKQETGSLPVITFEETEHDFGRIIEGETVAYSFKFSNTGKSDLILAEVSTSCGCTVASYPTTPIRPGEKEVIKVAFNSRGRRGYQSKNILVTSNTQPNTVLIRIKAQVVNPGSE